MLPKRKVTRAPLPKGIMIAIVNELMDSSSRNKEMENLRMEKIFKYAQEILDYKKKSPFKQVLTPSTIDRIHMLAIQIMDQCCNVPLNIDEDLPVGSSLDPTIVKRFRSISLSDKDRSDVVEVPAPGGSHGSQSLPPGLCCDCGKQH